MEITCDNCNINKVSINKNSFREYCDECKSKQSKVDSTSAVNHEFTSEEIKKERYIHRKDIVQSFRQGEFSKEYRDANPERSQEMVDEGIITKEQHDDATNLWTGDVEGY